MSSDPNAPASAPANTPLRPPEPPPPSAAAARRAPTGNEKIWALLSHLSVFLGVWFIIPLVVYLAMKQESEYVRDNAREALNFHLSLLIYGICLLPLVWLLIGIPLLAVLLIGALILSIVAAVKASDGSVYRYPLTIRLIN